jgi:hypothetical protein
MSPRKSTVNHSEVRMRFTRCFVLLSFLVQQITVSPAAVWGADSEAPALLKGGCQADVVNDMSKKIALKEIELLRLNTNFREHYTKHDKWQERRLNVYNTAGSAVANAGVITLISEFWKYHHRVGEGLVHKGRLESGLIQVIVAYCLVGAGHAGELLYNAEEDYKGKRKGFGAKETLKRVQTLRGEIDTLLTQRAEAVGTTSSAERGFLDAEGKVLEDARDLALIDFSGLYVQSRKKKMVRDLLNLGTVAVAATGAFPGATLALGGVRRVRLKQVGGSGIGFMVSAGILTGAPFLFKFGEVMQSSSCSKKMREELGEYKCHAVQRMTEDLKALEAELASAGSLDSATPIKKRLQAYAMTRDMVSERTDILEREGKQAKQQFVEDVISYGVRGGPQIAWSAMLMNAGYKHFNNPSVAFKRVGEAATVEEVSWAYWLLDSLQYGTRREIANYRGRRLFSFKKNLAELDHITATIQ